MILGVMLTFHQLKAKVLTILFT